MISKGLVVAGPSSGPGRTTVPLGLMSALKRRGPIVEAFKANPRLAPEFDRQVARHRSLAIGSEARR
jgi:cobyrinic acid a,c-diamide synthase